MSSSNTPHSWLQVLIERILATCPDVGQLYLLMREKRDQAPEKRLLQLKQSQVGPVFVPEHNIEELGKRFSSVVHF